jgi:hypothetical protein
MRTRLTSPSPTTSAPKDFPDADELAALRAWYAGLSARGAVAQYLPASIGEGSSARGALGHIRRKLVAVARRLHRGDLATLFARSAERLNYASAVALVKLAEVLFWKVLDHL